MKWHVDVTPKVVKLDRAWVSASCQDLLAVRVELNVVNLVISCLNALPRRFTISSPNLDPVHPTWGKPISWKLVPAELTAPLVLLIELNNYSVINYKNKLTWPCVFVLRYVPKVNLGVLVCWGYQPVLVKRGPFYIFTSSALFKIYSRDVVDLILRVLLLQLIKFEA
jgi:hypothetical protein